MVKRTRLLSRAVLALALAATPLTLATEVFAQGAPPPTDAVKEVARQRYEEGVKALDEKRFDAARVAFEQAFALTSSPAVLLNLAVAESNSNRCVDAGNHVHRFLREHKAATPANKTLSNTILEDCKKKVAVLNISVDTAGADVAVDGKAVGKSPIEDPFFVEPGSHVVVATKDGKSATTKADAAKGTSANVIVSLGAVTAPPLPPGPAPTDPNAPAPQIGQPPVAPLQPVQPSSDQGEDFGEWYVRKPLAWVGTGVVGVGLGVSIAFSALSASSLATTNEIADQIRKEKEDRGVTGAPCAEEEGGGDAAGFEGGCSQLRDADSVHSANQAVMAVGWVVTGLAAAGTVTYIMLDWYTGSRVSGAKDTEGGPTVGFVPVISHDTVGGTLVGSF